MPRTQKMNARGKAPDFSKLLVKDIMESEVQTAHAHTKADVIASRMIEGFGAVPVVDGKGRLIGIVSEHDLLASLNRGQRWSETTAQEVMTQNPYSIPPQTSVGTLVHVLQASNLIRVPVVDKGEKLVGIVARRDVIKAYVANTKPSR